MLNIVKNVVKFDDFFQIIQIGIDFSKIDDFSNYTIRILIFDKNLIKIFLGIVKILIKIDKN